MAAGVSEKSGDAALSLPAEHDANANVDGEEKTPGFRAYLRIFTFAGPIDIAMMVVAIVAALASGTIMGLLNLVFGKFITVLGNFTRGNSNNDEFLREVSKLSLYFVYLGIGKLCLVYIYSALSTYSAYHITRNIRRAYLHAALSQEIAFFDHGTGGAVAMQATSNGNLIQSGISEKLALTFQALATFISAFIVAFVSQWKLTLIIICITPAIVITIGTVALFDTKLENKILGIYAQAGSYAEGILGSARTVHAFDIRSRLVRSYEKYLADARVLGNKKNVLYGIMFGTEYFVIYAGMGLAFWQGMKMFANGEVSSVGTVFTVLMSVISAATTITMLAPYSVSFSRAASAAAQLFVLVDRQSQINPFDESGEKPAGIIGTVDLESIDFAYPTRPGTKVLSNFSLHVPAGKVTALVGASGSGKSTIVGLLERWYAPNTGTIKLDGKPIDQLNLRWLRTNVRLVQQEPVLFNETVFDNIANGLVGTEMENAPRNEQLKLVESAAKVAFAHDFIAQLPEGYDTLIGERGGLLSGGQRQRIAIARSIISKPKILLLDEATSALDPHAESIVQQALDNASRHRTTIVIAHKLATIREADNIVVISKGSIIEQGTHNSLLAMDGAYARLVKAQSLSVASGQGKADSSTSSQSGNDEATVDDEVARALTRYATSDQRKLESLKERDDYDSYNPFGVVSAIIKVAMATPDLQVTYLFLALACVLGAGVYPAQSLLLGNVMDIFNLDDEAMKSRGNFFSLMFFVMAIGILIVYFVLGWASNIVCQTMNQKLRRDLFDGMLRQDLQFFDRPENTVGALASRLESYPQAILELMGMNIMVVLISILSVVACSILGIVVSWKLGLVGVFAGVPPMMIAGYIRTRLDAKMEQNTSKRFSASASVASEAITAIRTVSSLTIEERVLSKYAAKLDDAISLSTLPLIHNMVWFAFTQAIDYFILALGFWWGCTLSSRGEVSFYQFIVSFMGVFFSGQTAGQLFSYSSSLTKGSNAVNFYFWLQSLKPVIQETPENREIGPKDGVQRIDFDHVQFSYPLRSDTRVLRGVDLEILPGQFVALVGASGCGKSTTIAMLERFYDPTCGTIRIDGEAMASLNPRLYRKQLALVQQEPVLYPGSIRENIALGIEEGDLTDARIETALRAANAWDFVSSLPDGVHTPCGTSGSQLSGGQRQRVAIARALIREPQVILLDEATSALDTESERIVQAALNDAAKRGDRITVAVAHRLSTIKDADRICVFYGGMIVESGNHSELIDLGGMYKRMCEAQNLDKAV